MAIFGSKMVIFDPKMAGNKNINIFIRKAVKNRSRKNSLCIVGSREAAKFKKCHFWSPGAQFNPQRPDLGATNGPISHLQWSYIKTKSFSSDWQCKNGLPTVIWMFLDYCNHPWSYAIKGDRKKVIFCQKRQF